MTLFKFSAILYRDLFIEVKGTLGKLQWILNG